MTENSPDVKKPTEIREFDDLLERCRDVAGSTAVTELWCLAAQTLIYDLRDALVARKPARPPATRKREAELEWAVQKAAAQLPEDPRRALATLLAVLPQ